MMRAAVTPLLIAGSISLSACGLGVPQIGEIWDDNTGTLATPLEKKIKEKIYCELNSAVADLNSDKEKFIPVSYQDPKNPSKTITIMIPPVPETWGATLTLTLQVEEMSARNPGSFDFEKKRSADSCRRKANCRFVPYCASDFASRRSEYTFARSKLAVAKVLGRNSSEQRARTSS